MSKVLIIGGAGRIGLALATVLSKVHSVGIYDTDSTRCDLIRKGQIPFYEPDIDITKIKVYTTLRQGLKENQYVLITIGTPIDEYLNPEFRPIYKLIDQLVHLGLDNKLVGLCSTVYPGTTKALMKRYDISLAFIPERIATGHMVKELYEIHQIIASKSSVIRHHFSMLFNAAKIKVTTMPNPVQAELIKLFSNSYRYINFAITNQFQIMCQKFEVQYKQIYKVMTENYPRMKSFPKPGFAGGYCLRKDTLQLAAVDTSFQLGLTASQINEHLPLMIFRQLRNIYKSRLSKMTIGLLGMSFKGNTDDIRDSLAYRMKKILANEVSEILWHDSYSKISGDLNYVLGASDLLIICAYHDEYDKINFNNLQKPVVDIMWKYNNNWCLHF